MPHYLLQVSYTADSWAAMVKNPQPRTKALEGVVQRMGGKIEAAYLSFGEHDTIAIFELPSNVDIAAFSIAAAAAGGLKAIRTTPLLTVEEGVEAMTKAAKVGYVRPGA